MFPVEFAIPQLKDIYVEDYEFRLDIYKNTQARLLVESPSLDPEEIAALLKMYDTVTVILNGVMAFTLTPGYARIEDDTKLEIYMYGHIANLFKKHGYYTNNGNGLVDYTVIDEETGVAVGICPIELASSVLEHTNFKLAYAPSLTKNGTINPNNRIFIRGEWLNRSEWIYEIANNCFFYEYVGPEIVVNGHKYKPDFTTDVNTTFLNDDDAYNGKLIDCCNVVYDDVGNIIIGISGCEYLGNNNWKKIITDITQYVLSPKDTVFNFITYENAVVQGGELQDPKNDAKKRTYLAHPIHLNMYEMFKNTFNKETYTYDGLSRDDAWTLQDDGNNLYLQCETYRSGDRNFVCYDFATIDGLIANMGETNTFQVDFVDISGTQNIPWPAQENDRLILSYCRRRAGFFFNQQWPYFEEHTEDKPRTNEQMKGYFVYLEQITNPVERGYVIPDDPTYQFVGHRHELYVCMGGHMNMFSDQEEDHTYYDNSVKREEQKIILRERLDDTFNPGKMLDTPHTLRVDITPEYTNNFVTAYKFKITVWQTSDPSVTREYERTVRILGGTPWYTSGKCGLFTYTRAPNMVASEGDYDDIGYPYVIKFDNYIVSCMSETLYGNVDKPIIMHRSRAINNNTQGVMVAQALLETQNRDKDINVTIDPLLFFERGLVLGQWVTINYPLCVQSDGNGYRVCGITVTPDEVELCLNHSDIRFTDQVDGIKKLVDVLDSF